MHVHQKNPVKPHFLPQNFENVGLAGQESESSEDKVSI